MPLTPPPFSGIRMTPEGEPMPTVDDLIDSVSADLHHMVDDDRGMRPQVLIPLVAVGVALLAGVILYAKRH